MLELSQMWNVFLSSRIFWWMCIFAASGLFTLCDSMAKVWMDGGRWHWYAFASLFIISPIAYMVFGYVTKKVGLAVASGLVNSFLVLGTMLVGLVLMKEWNKVSTVQYTGMAFAAVGIILMLFFPKKAEIIIQSSL